LFTDKYGKSSFRITFPDDITQWDATVYAMSKYLQTGTIRKSIKSYKPLMAELGVPQFLTKGDSAFFSGKVLNYTSGKSIEGSIQFTGAGTELKKNISFGQYHADLLPVHVTSTDSITARYVFTRDDGYTDGEERTVPVVEEGIIRAEGTLEVLKNGEERNVTAGENEVLTVEFVADQINVYRNEIDYLFNYRYACNEQLASRLIGLLNDKMLTQYEGLKFYHDREINKIINRLLKNQNDEFLWSWWDRSENTSYWMSAHVLRALKYAKDKGYQVDLNIGNIVSKAEYKFNFLKSYSLYDIDLLHALATWNAGLNYGKYVQVLDSMVRTNELRAEKDYSMSNYRYSYLKEKLTLQEIRQMRELNYKSDSLMKYKKEGVLGEVFFSDGLPSPWWYNNEMEANMVAYRLVRNDSLLRDLITPMQMYFLSTRKNAGWNTYESSNLLMTVLSDLIAQGTSRKYPAVVNLAGKENKTISSFPYRIDLNPQEQLHIEKESGAPVYLMKYTKERVTHAKTGVEGFRIKTWFTNNNMQLDAGKPVDLIVDVDVEKQLPVENVMIEVPITASCSYTDKRQPYYNEETHREYFKERTVIFCDILSPGRHTFVIHLLPRFTGKYKVNPAQVSLMYLPVVNANTDMKEVKVSAGN
jgi:uncharacterized protein YfaS (alpha-2-macroglobulin family)